MTMPVETKKNSITISWVKGVQLAVEVWKHRIMVDQPLEEGGQDQGISPGEMFVGSLGACIGYFAVGFCQRHKIPTAGLKVAMEWDYAE
ncbi:MAG TPA: OsmC family protein [Nitrospiria bacterium]|nr:OsmC family protein [Nitrospiria bacterium]